MPDGKWTVQLQCPHGYFVDGGAEVLGGYIWLPKDNCPATRSVMHTHLVEDRFTHSHAVEGGEHEHP
jgi:hypothetical protein